MPTQSGEIAWFQPKENPKSTATPGARSGHSITCVSEKVRVRTTLVLRPSCGTGPPHPAPPLSPQRVRFFTCACALAQAYFFGGCGPKDNVATVFNDMHVLHINEQFRWEKVDAMGDVPPPRWCHTATLLPDNKSIFVFGGLNKVSAAAVACLAPHVWRASRQKF